MVGRRSLGFRLSGGFGGSEEGPSIHFGDLVRALRHGHHLAATNASGTKMAQPDGGVIRGFAGHCPDQGDRIAFARNAKILRGLRQFQRRRQRHARRTTAEQARQQQTCDGGKFHPRSSSAYHSACRGNCSRHLTAIGLDPYGEIHYRPKYQGSVTCVTCWGGISNLNLILSWLLSRCFSRRTPILSKPWLVCSRIWTLR